MEQRRIGRLLLGMVGVLLAVLAVVELPARAEPPTPVASNGWSAEEAGRAAIAAAQTPGLEIGGGMVMPGGPEDEDAGDEGGDDGVDSGSGTTTIVERLTIWRILFPYETLSESIRAALMDLGGDLIRDVSAQGEHAIDWMTNLYVNEEGLMGDIKEVRQDVWSVGIVIAGLLMPLSFMASVVAAMKDGTTSVTGYASVREALLNWLIGAGAAISSYFLLSKIITLSQAMNVAILERVLAQAVGNFDLGEAMWGALVVATTYSVANVGAFVVALFGMVMGIALTASIALATLAREVILVLAMGLAPIMLVLGSLGPLRWLNGLWVKVTSIAIAIGPANMFVIGAGALLMQRAMQISGDGLGEGVADLGSGLLQILMAVGVVSVVIGLNTMVGKAVYGAAIELAQKTVNGIAVAAGAVVGLGVGGLAGGAGLAVSGAGATSGAGVASGAAGTLGAAAQASSSARMVGSIGQAVAAMGVPGGKGFAAGMNAGGAVSAHQQVKQGIAAASEARAGRGEGDAPLGGDLSMGQAIDSAHANVSGELASEGHRRTLGSRGISPDDAQQRVDVGREVTHNLATLGERYGVDMRAGLAQLGVRGTNAQGAGEAYARASILETAFSVPSPFSPVAARGLAQEVTARDLDTARVIVSQVRPDGLRSAPSVGFLDSLVQTAHLRRTQLGEDPGTTVGEACQAASLQEWMRETYLSLPNRGAADRLREGLGL